MVEFSLIKNLLIQFIIVLDNNIHSITLCVVLHFMRKYTKPIWAFFIHGWREARRIDDSHSR